MVLQPTDRAHKQAIELSLAQIDPNASFEERVAQFDNMEAIAKKRKCKRSVLGPTTCHFTYTVLIL